MTRIEGHRARFNKCAANGASQSMGVHARESSSRLPYLQSRYVCVLRGTRARVDQSAVESKFCRNNTVEGFGEEVKLQKKSRQLNELAISFYFFSDYIIFLFYFVGA